MCVGWERVWGGARGVGGRWRSADRAREGGAKELNSAACRWIESGAVDTLEEQKRQDARQRQAPLDLQEQRISADMTLGDYLTAGGYGERFIRHYIVPMGAAIWSMSLADMLGFPLQFFVRFFKNHGLLSVSNRPQWCVIEGGSSSYIEPLTRGFREQIRLNCPVDKVARSEAGVVIHSSAGSEHFDRVVFACHSDQALALLADPSQAEQEILGALPYADNDVVLHTDTRLLPDRKLAWASWNYRLITRSISFCPGRRPRVVFLSAGTGLRRRSSSGHLLASPALR